MRLEVEFVPDRWGSTLVKVDGSVLENVQFVSVSQRAGELPIATIEVLCSSGVRVSKFIAEARDEP